MFIIIGIVLLVVCFIVAFIAIFLLPADKAKKREILQIISVFCLTLGLVSIMASLMVANKEMITSKIDYTVNDTIEIYNLEDNTSANGTFFLGSGKYNNKTYYCYYMLTKDGYMYDKISPEDYKIYMNYINDDEKPHIDTLCKTRVKVVNNEYYWLVSLKALLKPEEYKVGTIISTKTFPYFKQYKIYIPKGTIDENYKIDME